MKHWVIVSVFLSAAAAVFRYSDAVETYVQFYNANNTVVGKLEILREMGDADLADTLDFFADALEDLVVTYPSIRGSLELDAADTTARFLVEKLGGEKLLSEMIGPEKYQDVTANIWRVAQSFNSAVVKAEALIALGRMQATEFLPQVIRILQGQNNGPGQDRLGGEQIAYGAIVSLEKYRDISGYLPVFFASTGWYIGWVRNHASSSLSLISADPTEPLTQVIQGPEYSYAVKLLALQTVNRSSVSPEKKSGVALAAYTEAWRAATSDIRQRMDLVQIRKLSQSMIREYGTGDAAVYPLLDRSYREGADEEEKLGVIATLASLASEDSVRLLSEYITAINAKQQDGTLVALDERLIRAMIPALGATGQTQAVTALRSVQNADWTNAVKQLAAQALRSLQ